MDENRPPSDRPGVCRWANCQPSSANALSGCTPATSSPTSTPWSEQLAGDHHRFLGELLRFETIHYVACALLKRRLAAALAKVSDVQLEDGQRQAENAKRYLRRLVADADKRVPSFSGRPLW